MKTVHCDLTNIQEALCLEAGTSLCIWGDSFSNDTYDWPFHVDFPFSNYAVAGNALDEMLVNFESELASSSECGAIVIAGGVNDVSGRRPVADMQASLLAMIAASPSGVPIIVAGVSPFGGSSIDTTDRQLLRDEYNLWLSTLAGVTFWDWNLVLDADGDGVIDPAVALGDGIHPSVNPPTGLGSGMQALGEQFMSLFSCP